MKSNYFVLVGFCFFSIISSFAQKKDKMPKGESEQRYNRVDEKGMPQGFSKMMLPDGMGHHSNYQEGFFYNGKKIGVWYKKNYQGKIYEMEIFYDTSQNKIEYFGYYSKIEMQKEHGFYYLTAMNKKDTFEFKDPVTGHQRITIWDSTSMKQGKWSYYYENGQLESEGNYENDKRKGIWKYYNNIGELFRTEEF